MKRILMIMLSGFLTLSLTAQTLTIKFNGTNRNRNYQVVLDGTSYYSNTAIDPNSINTSVSKDIRLTNQQLGSHTLAVYRVRNNNGNYNNGNNTVTNGNAIYTKTFQLRQSYDMDITISGYGQVTFTERRIRNRGRDYNQNVQAMSDVTFNQVLQSVRSKWIQSARITTERNAFLTTSNYFSTDQVRQLLLLIGSEPNRLALAKLAYPRVADASNFTQLYDVFNSTASRNNLNTFIRNNPNNNGYNRDNRRDDRDNRDDRNNRDNRDNRDNNNGQYRTAMADYQFSQLLQNANSQYSQSDRVIAIRNAISTSNAYFNTSQIRQLLSIVNAEGDRLSLAKLSYLRVADPANFSSLYDLFYNQAARNDLNNYVIQNGGTSTYNNNTQYNNRIAMDASTFSLVLEKVNNHILPWDKVRDARDAFNNTSYYFSTSQIRQILSVILTENDRLDLAKLAWSRVSDPSSFTQLFDLFSSQSSRNDLNAYIQAHPF
jgi:hypothetical protein